MVPPLSPDNGLLAEDYDIDPIPLQVKKKGNHMDVALSGEEPIPKFGTIRSACNTDKWARRREL